MRTRQARAHHHTFKDEDMSSTTTLTPREKQARRYATTLALIATLGPFFYGFEGMVLNAAVDQHALAAHAVHQHDAR